MPQAVAAVPVKWGLMALTAKAAMAAMACHPLLRVRQPTTRVVAVAWSSVAPDLVWVVLGEEAGELSQPQDMLLVSPIPVAEAEGIEAYLL